VEISANVGVEVWVDDRMMGEGPGKVLVPGGRHIIELRASGFEPQKVEIHITARETQSHTFVLKEITEFEGLSPAYFWTGAGLTVAALGTGIYVGLKALEKDAEGTDRRDENPYLNSESDEDEVKDLALTADILYGVAGVLAVGTTLLFFFTDWEGDGEEESEEPGGGEEARAVFAPLLGRDALGIGATGSF
jgi:hypothetical protein